VKRYLLSIVLVLFAVAGIGSYYAYGASDRLPEFRLAAVQGDGAIGDRIRLSGSYGGRMFSQFLAVSAQGSDYDRDRSIFHKWRERVRLADADPEIAALIREHRRFMRGKPRYAWALNNLHKDREWLIFADAKLYQRGPSAWDLAATIEMLSLSGGEVRRYDVLLDQTSAAAGGYVQDVARIGEKLHLIIQIGYDRYADYILDMNGRLIEKVILSGEEDGPENGGGRYITAFPSSSGDALAMAVTKTDPETGAARKISFHRYHYASGSISKLAEIPIDQKEGEKVAVYAADDQFAVLIHDEQTARWRLLPARGGTSLPPEQSAKAGSLGGKEIKTAYVADGIAFLLMKNGSRHVVAAIDLSSGALLYSGRVELAGAAAHEEEELALLRLNNLYVAPREGSD